MVESTPSEGHQLGQLGSEGLPQSSHHATRDLRLWVNTLAEGGPDLQEADEIGQQGHTLVEGGPDLQEAHKIGWQRFQDTTMEGVPVVRAAPYAQASLCCGDDPFEDQSFQVVVVKPAMAVDTILSSSYLERSCSAMDGCSAAIGACTESLFAGSHESLQTAWAVPRVHLP